MRCDLENFHRQTQSAKKIIVVDLGFLGDSVHLTPALWEIKRNLPQAALHVLSSALGCEVLKLAACVDKTWAFPLTLPSPPWWKHWGIIHALRRENFDVAFNFSGADRSIFLTALTGARWKLAHPSGRKHFWNSWLIPNWAPRQTRSVPVFEQRRQVLAACGYPLQPARFDLRAPESALQWAAATVPQKSIHLSINASASIKEWPLENWVGLAKILLQKDPAVRLVATASAKPRERERINALATAINDPRLECFEGLSIGQLTGLLQRCQLQVGADSGVLHLAMALGTPTFSIFRRYEGLEEWMAIGSQHRYLAARCRCIDERKNDCVMANRAACLGEVSAEQVFLQIQQQLYSA
jgi:heptosyltransferase-1